jgi:hypothetical protein
LPFASISGVCPAPSAASRELAVAAAQQRLALHFDDRDIKVITPNPKTSGGAELEKAKSFVRELGFVVHPSSRAYPTSRCRAASNRAAFSVVSILDVAAVVGGSDARPALDETS